MKFKLSLLAVLLIRFVFTAEADGTLDRALWGSLCGRTDATSKNYAQTINKLLLSWRMLPGDDADTSFDIYRRYNDGAEKKLLLSAKL